MKILSGWRVVFCLSFFGGLILFSDRASATGDDVCLYMFARRNTEHGGALEEMAFYVAAEKWQSQPEVLIWGDELPSIGAAVSRLKSHIVARGGALENCRIVDISLRAPNVVFGHAEKPSRLFYLVSFLDGGKSPPKDANRVSYVIILTTGDVVLPVERRMENGRT